MAAILKAVAGVCMGGAVGFGFGSAWKKNALECDSNALVPTTSMQVSGSPVLVTQDIALTGCPTLPPKPPSAAAVLQWTGWPGFDNIKFRQGYVGSYNRQTKNPWWVCEHLCRETMSGDGNRKGGGEPFAEDISDPPHLRSKLEDFRGSGFDRGHLVAASDIKFSQTAMDETFLLSNMSPQVGEGFNRGYWERLERWCRGLVFGGSYSDVFVLSGPIYLPAKEGDGKYYMHHQVLGNPPSVHVPTHFFKVVLALPSRSAQEVLTLTPVTPNKNDPNTFALQPVRGTKPPRPIAVTAFVLPNQVIPEGTDLKQFEVPIDVAERFAGLQFFPRLPRNQPSVVANLCKETKCQLPPPFQPRDNNGKPRIVEIK